MINVFLRKMRMFNDKLFNVNQNLKGFLFGIIININVGRQDMMQNIIIVINIDVKL